MPTATGDVNYRQCNQIGLRWYSGQAGEVARWRRQALGDIYKRGDETFAIVDAAVRSDSIDNPDQRHDSVSIWYWAFTIVTDDESVRTMPVATHLTRVRSGEVERAGHMLDGTARAETFRAFAKAILH